MKKRLFCLALTVVCCFALLVPALAAEPAAQPIEVHAELWSNHVTVGREVVGFWDSEGYRRTPLAYNGTVYIPLRTAGMWMGADVDWVQETMTVALTHNGQEPRYPGPNDAGFQQEITPDMTAQKAADIRQGVDIQIRPDITVTLDGEVQHFTNALGAPVYPVLFRECIYLPVRSIGELCGKEVLWVPVPISKGTVTAKPISAIFLYDKPTREQMEEAEGYVAQAPALAEQLLAGIEALGRENDLTEETFLERMADLKALATELKDLPFPSADPMFLRARSVAGNADEIITEHMMVYLDPEHMMRPEYRDKPWQYNRDVFVSVVEIVSDRLRAAVILMDRVYEGMRANCISGQ